MDTCTRTRLQFPHFAGLGFFRDASGRWVGTYFPVKLGTIPEVGVPVFHRVLIVLQNGHHLLSESDSHRPPGARNDTLPDYRRELGHHAAMRVWRAGTVWDGP